MNLNKLNVAVNFNWSRKRNLFKSWSFQRSILVVFSKSTKYIHKIGENMVTLLVSVLIQRQIQLVKIPCYRCKLQAILEQVTNTQFYLVGLWQYQQIYSTRTCNLVPTRSQRMWKQKFKRLIFRIDKKLYKSLNKLSIWNSCFNHEQEKFKEIKLDSNFEFRWKILKWIYQQRSQSPSVPAQSFPILAKNRLTQVNRTI